MRYHEAIGNVTPADKFYGRDKMILERREKVRRESMKMRRELYGMATIRDASVAKRYQLDYYEERKL